MDILFIADTHGNLDESMITTGADLCMMLGDHSLGDVYKVLNKYPKERIRGILGNHDIVKNGYLSYFNIPHLDYEEINGIRFLGVDGCLKYKEGYQKPFQWTSVEYEEYMDVAPACDILITHTSSMLFSLKPGNAAHQGVQAFNRYCAENNVKHHIHGHNHIRGTMLHDGWFETCVYGVQMIRL